MSKKQKQKEQYTVILEMAGEKYKYKAETINEALENLGLSWVDIKAKGVIIVSKNK